MRKIAIVLLLPLSLFAQELVGTFSLDTNKYMPFDIEFIIGVFIGPETYKYDQGLEGYRIKGTNQIDIFTWFFQKIGTITFPDQPPPGKKISEITFSQKFLDEDIGWEFIINYRDSVSEDRSFKVIDEAGTILLSDEYNASYGCDGQNTYVIANASYPKNPFSRKVWKFRSNISSASHPLSKTPSTPGPMITYMPSGDLQLKLQPTNGGTNIQVFDFLGRQIFAQDIQNLREAKTFKIPSNNLPNSPFITQVNNNNGSFAKKMIPVN
jgi:hypothetical protein